jgi:predicted dehydrogenase
VAAFCDVSEEKLKARTEEYGKYGPARTYSDHTDMLNDPAVDIVEVLTPHYLHKQMVLDSLAAGKHVSLQKPPAINLEEMDDMIAAAEKAGTKFKVFENFVFYPPYLLAKKLFEAGEEWPVAFASNASSLAGVGGASRIVGWQIVRRCARQPCLWDDSYSSRGITCSARSKRCSRG